MQIITKSRLTRKAISFLAREYPYLGCRIVKLKRPVEKDETGGSVSAEYCYSVFLRHFSYIKEKFPNQSLNSIIEIGPGDSIGVGIAALLSGFSHYYGLDAQCYAKKELNIEIFEKLKTLFINRNKIPEGLKYNNVKPFLESYEFPHKILDDEYLEAQLDSKRLGVIENVLNLMNCSKNSVNYIVGYNAESIPQESCDLIVSQAALEHVMNIDETYKWMAKWLKSGGLVSLQIDFKSHGTSLDWNGHWLYTEDQWGIVMDSKTFRNINRLPFSQHMKKLVSSGFEIKHIRVVESDSKLKRRHLAEHWRDIVTDDDLRIESAYILAKKL